MNEVSVEYQAQEMEVAGAGGQGNIDPHQMQKSNMSGSAL